jgi:Ca-activated chloride channel homolog
MGFQTDRKVATMTLTWHWPWTGLVGSVVALVIVALSVTLGAKRRTESSQLPVYGLDADLNIEHIGEEFHRFRLYNRFATALLVLALMTALTLVARPSVVDENDENANPRDIVLCLDVSPSMLAYDHEVLSTYEQLISGFKGERIALSLFNSTSRTLFPLTDDYDLATSQLKRTSEILRKVSTQDRIDKLSDRDAQDFTDLIEGTQNRSDKTSLIGDGLVSCAAMLPGFVYGHPSKPGKSSIVLATDNVSGKSDYTLGSALDLTSKANITVDGLYDGPAGGQQDKSTLDMRSEIEKHGGTYSSAHSGQSVDKMMRALEKRKSQQNEQVRLSSLIDAPGWFTLVAATLLGLWIALAWRIRR